MMHGQQNVKSNL